MWLAWTYDSLDLVPAYAAPERPRAIRKLHLRNPLACNAPTCRPSNLAGRTSL